MAAKPDLIIFAYKFLFDKFPRVFTFNRSPIAAATVHQVVIASISDRQLRVQAADLIVGIFEHNIRSFASDSQDFHSLIRRIDLA